MSPFCFTNASCQQMLCGRCSPFRRLQQHKIKTELTRAANEQEAGYVLLLLLSKAPSHLVSTAQNRYNTGIIDL